MALLKGGFELANSKIKQARKKKGLSFKDLSKKVPLDINTIRKLEKSKIKVSRVHKFFLDKILNINLEVEIPQTEVSKKMENFINNNHNNKVVIDDLKRLIIAYEITGDDKLVIITVRKNCHINLDTHQEVINECIAIINELESNLETFPNNNHVYPIYGVSESLYPKVY